MVVVEENMVAEGCWLSFEKRCTGRNQTRNQSLRDAPMKGVRAPSVFSISVMDNWKLDLLTDNY
jgi:hypothetical protein